MKNPAQFSAEINSLASVAHVDRHLEMAFHLPHADVAGAPEGAAHPATIACRYAQPFECVAPASHRSHDMIHNRGRIRWQQAKAPRARQRVVQPCDPALRPDRKVQHAFLRCLWLGHHVIQWAQAPAFGLFIIEKRMVAQMVIVIGHQDIEDHVGIKLASIACDVPAYAIAMASSTTSTSG